MAKKVKLTLYVDRKVIEDAKRSGLNLSVIAENAFKEAVRRLKGESSEPHKRTRNPGSDCNTVVQGNRFKLPFKSTEMKFSCLKTA